MVFVHVSSPSCDKTYKDSSDARTSSTSPMVRTQSAILKTLSSSDTSRLSRLHGALQRLPRISKPANAHRTKSCRMVSRKKNNTMRQQLMRLVESARWTFSITTTKWLFWPVSDFFKASLQANLYFRLKFQINHFFSWNHIKVRPRYPSIVRDKCCMWSYIERISCKFDSTLRQ